MQLASKKPPDSATYHVDATSVQGYLRQSYNLQRVKCSWSFWFVSASKNGVSNCTKWKKVCGNGIWTNTSWNVQCQHPRMTWSARTTADEEFWRKMASKVIQATHKVTKGYLATSSLIKIFWKNIVSKEMISVCGVDTGYVWHMQLKLDLEVEVTMDVSFCG